jgi:hypothetical protein
MTGSDVVEEYVLQLDRRAVVGDREVDLEPLSFRAV